MFSDKIWVTRKTRIYSEQRLQRKNISSLILMIFYSALLVFLSIWNLSHSNESFNILSIFGAIAVLISSVLLISQRYTERALAMRNCYIHLDDFYLKAKRAEEGGNTETLNDLESSYSKILANVENHTDYDYLCLRWSLRNIENTTLPEFKKEDFINFIWAKSWRAIILILLFFMPIFMVILWNIIKAYVRIV